MSVTLDRRKENKLDVFLQARNLANYTIKICSNDKIFLPIYRDSIISDIEKTAKDIFIDSWSANNILVKSSEDLQERLSLQVSSIRKCNTLLSLIQLVKPLFHLSAKRIRYWGTQTIEVRNKLQAWNRKDKLRYKEFL